MCSLPVSLGIIIHVLIGLIGVLPPLYSGEEKKNNHCQIHVNNELFSTACIISAFYGGNTPRLKVLG